jgi:hypothetical protein
MKIEICEKTLVAILLSTLMLCSTWAIVRGMEIEKNSTAGTAQIIFRSQGNIPEPAPQPPKERST